MKIDIHTHTKKCKSGDAPTREISPEKFCEAVLSTEVRIIAITNHNVFDLNQYTEIEIRFGKDAQMLQSPVRAPKRSEKLLDLILEGVLVSSDHSAGPALLSRGHLWHSMPIVSPTRVECAHANP